MIVSKLDDVPEDMHFAGLTIGSFDGVHLGHQFLLKTLKAKLPPNSRIAVFTFANHPSHHFTPHSPTPLICPPLQKAKLLESYGADLVILSHFTPELSRTPFDQFLRQLKEKLSFTHLVLGEGATFGKKREGNEENIKQLAPTLEFQVEYLPKFNLHDTALSSGRVRELIAKGQLHDVHECLGRSYSLMGKVETEDRFYIFNAEGLCLLPEGVYPVRIQPASHSHLGRAQVLSKEQKIRLELLENQVLKNLNEVEVIF